MGGALKAGALQSAIFNRANFFFFLMIRRPPRSTLFPCTTLFLSYTAAEVMNKITPADISDPQELIARAKALSGKIAPPISPRAEPLELMSSLEIEDIYHLTYIRKDGTPFAAVVSVTALRDAQDAI